MKYTPCDPPKGGVRGAPRWYNPLGQVCGWLIRKDAPADGGREADLQMAMDCFLLPSAAVIARGNPDPCAVRDDGSDAKVNVFMELLMAAAFELPREPGESLDSYQKRLHREIESRLAARQAREAEAHAAIASVHRGSGTPAPETLKVAVADYARWHADHVSNAVLVGEVLVSREGFAGPVDAVLRLRDERTAVCGAVLVERGEPEEIYSCHGGVELGGHTIALSERGIGVDCAFTVVLRPDTGKAHAHFWESKDGLAEQFRHRLGLYSIIYGYDLQDAYRRGLEMWGAPKDQAKGG